MFPGIYNAAKAMQFAEHQHEVSANNLAHINSPGHRRQVLTHHEFSAHLNGERNPPPRPNRSGDLYEGLETDFSAGPTKSTGRPLDVAIEGDGFFVIEGPQGPLYTRNGAMYLGDDGQIVTIDNLPVLGQGGPLQAPPNTSSEAIVISHDGSVYAGQTLVGQLQLAVPADLRDLRKMGDSLYAADADATIETVEGRFRQGMLEQSNVTPVNELVNLLVASRQYEAAQKVLSALSEALQQRIDLR